MLSLRSTTPTRATLLERVTLSGMLTTFGIAAGVSFALEIVWMLLGFRYFTAKETDVPWYYPIAMLITLLLMLSIAGLFVTGIAALIQRAQRE